MFENAFPKLLLLRDDLCVGLVGNDPEGSAQRLIAARNEPTESIVGLAAAMPHAAFVIASLESGPSLVKVERGVVEDRTELGRSWAGDDAAYSVFQQRYSEWPPGCSVAFLLVSSLQWLLSFNTVPSVGGYLTHVISTPEGFRYVPQETNVGPEMLNSVTRLTDAGLELSLTVPAGGDSTVHSHRCAAGVDPTPGALAYLLEPVGVGVLFRHEEPYKPVLLRAGSLADLVEVAAIEYGQSLAS